MAHRTLHLPSRVLAAALLTAALSAQNLVRDIGPPDGSNVGSSPAAFVQVGNLAFFTADDGYGVELWRTDGTAAGTWLVEDLAPGRTSCHPRDLTALGTLLVFTADVPGLGREMWRSDGTAAGTYCLGDVA